MSDKKREAGLDTQWLDVLRVIHNNRIVLDNMSADEVEKHEGLNSLELGNEEIADILSYSYDTNLIERHDMVVHSKEQGEYKTYTNPTEFNYTLSEKGFQILFENHTTEKQGKTQTGLVILTVILIIANIIAQIPNEDARVWLGAATLVLLFIFVANGVIPLPYLDHN